MAVITFNRSHVWATRKFENKWFVLDSLSWRPEPTEFQNIFIRQGCGYIVIWNNFESASKHQFSKSDSNVIKKRGTQSTASKSKRASKQPGSKKDIISDESALNRFEDNYFAS